MIVAVLVLGMAAAANAPAPGTVQGRLTRSYTQHLAAPPGEVFPLLGPVGEKKWGGEGWTPRFIYPVGGADEAGCVFATGAPDAETIWMLTTFDRTAGRVEYVQMTPGMRVTRLQIDLRPEGSEGTTAEIRYTWTSLSDKNEAFLAMHAGPAFDHAMAQWEGAVNAYLNANSRH